MGTVDIHEAAIRFPRLIDIAASGTDVIVTRHGKPLARITRLETLESSIKFGIFKRKMRIAADFDAPLPDEVLAGFEGR